jgi:hypothetical protein
MILNYSKNDEDLRLEIDKKKKTNNEEDREINICRRKFESW